MAAQFGNDGIRPPGDPESSEHEKEKIERLRRAMYSRSLSGKIEAKDRHELAPEKMEVSEDFEKKEEVLPATRVAPRAIGVARKALWGLLIGAIVFFVGAVGVFMFYIFYTGSSAATARSIDIAVSGPPQVESGAVTKLQIVVTNKNNAQLELADLVITYPDGTRAVDFTTALPTLRQPLGTIEPGGTRQGIVPAVLSGKEGASATIHVDLEYRLKGSSALFVASTDYNVHFSSSPLTVSVDGHTETVSGQPVELTLTVASNASEPVRDVLLQADFPFGFTFKSATPTMKEGRLFELGDFAPGQRKTVVLQGSLTGAQGDNRVFHFKAGTRTDKTKAALETTLFDQPFTMSISQPFLGLALKVNGAESQGVVEPGSTVTVSIEWKNNLPTPVTNATIVARLTGISIDGSTVKSTNGFYRSSDAVVLWDKNSNDELASIAPNARGTVTFTLQMPSSDTIGKVVNPKLDVSVNAAGNRISESGVPETLRSTATGKIALSSDLQLYAQGLFYANPFGQVGPMPPKAGAETNYAIVFTITNTTNKITDAYVKAQIPPYVRWTGHWSPGSIPLTDIEFNQQESTVIWHIGTIEPGVGIGSTPALRLALEMGLTPSQSQIGQQPAIIKNIELYGIDASKAAEEQAKKPDAPLVPTLLKTGKPDVTTNLIVISKSGSGTTIATDPGFSALNATVVK